MVWRKLAITCLSDEKCHMAYDHLGKYTNKILEFIKEKLKINPHKTLKS